jgi:hypothetical protein
MGTMKEMWRSDCLFAMDMAGGVQDLSPFGASGKVRKLHLQPPGSLLRPKHTYSLKRNFPFHRLFSDILLSGSDLERERLFKERASES